MTTTIGWEQILKASIELGIDPYDIGKVFEVTPEHSGRISVQDAIDQGDLSLAYKNLNQLSPENHPPFIKEIQEQYRERIKAARKAGNEHPLWGILAALPKENTRFDGVATFAFRSILGISMSKGTMIQSWNVFKHPRANHIIKNNALFCILNISFEKKDMSMMWKVFGKSLKHHPAIALEALSVILSLSIQENNLAMVCKVYQQILSKFEDESYELRESKNNIKTRTLLAIDIMIGRALSSKDNTILNVFTYHNLPEGKSKKEVLRYLVEKFLAEK